MLELQVMAVEVSGAAVRLIRWQGSKAPVDIYRDEEAEERGRPVEVIVPAGWEIITTHARFRDPEQALAFAEAIKSVARRCIHLRSLEGDKL